MTAASGPGLPGLQISLFEHARHLHAAHPDSPLPGEGAPYPDEPLHHPRSRPHTPFPYSRAGAAVAAVLDEHFSRPDAEPAGLEWAFHGVHVPISWDEHVVAAAWRADEQRVRDTGRWLVTHSRDRCSAMIGLALLATGLADDDVPLIRTLGLLSHEFGALAAYALRRRRATEALLWLADRVKGWGRVYIVEALCDSDPCGARSWLLRWPCDGDLISGYFAGQVATAAHLHEAITSDDADDELIDQAGRLLLAMANCAGMGITLATYPPARAVIAAHRRHLARQEPTFRRWANTALLAGYLTASLGEDLLEGNIDFPAPERQHMADQYALILNRDDWTAVADAHLKEGDDYSEWIAYATRRVPLNAFTDAPGDT